MAVTEYERSQLFGWFEEHMGKERAATMRAMLSPVDWTEVATKRDIEHLDTKIDRVAQRLDNRIDVLDARLNGRFDAVEARFDGRLDAVDARFDAIDARIRSEARALRADLQRTFATWMFAAQGAVVAAIGLLLALLR